MKGTSAQASPHLGLTLSTFEHVYHCVRLSGRHLPFYKIKMKIIPPLSWFSVFQGKLPFYKNSFKKDISGSSWALIRSFIRASSALLQNEQEDHTTSSVVFGLPGQIALL